MTPAARLSRQPALRLLPTTTAPRALLHPLAPPCGSSRAAGPRRGSPAGPSTAGAAPWPSPLLATLVVAVTLLVGAVSARLAGGGDPSSAVGAPSPTSAVALRGRGGCASWVVAPGDTLWSIAAAVAPDADVRVTVDRLVELNGDAPIIVGQQLRLRRRSTCTGTQV